MRAHLLAREQEEQASEDQRQRYRQTALDQQDQDTCRSRWILEQGPLRQQPGRHRQKQGEAGRNADAQPQLGPAPARQQSDQMQQHGGGSQHRACLKGTARAEGSGPQQIDGNDNHQRGCQPRQGLEHWVRQTGGRCRRLADHRQDGQQGQQQHRDFEQGVVAAIVEQHGGDRMGHAAVRQLLRHRCPQVDGDRPQFKHRASQEENERHG